MNRVKATGLVDPTKNKKQFLNGVVAQRSTMKVSSQIVECYFFKNIFKKKTNISLLSENLRKK